MNRVDGKVALVTGGGSGIGRASCELLAKAGAHVVVSDINVDAAEETAETILASGGKAVAVQHDVAREADWERVIELTLKQFTKLNVLVNNAGITTTKECKSTSLEEWRRVVGVTLEGTFLGVRGAIRTMVNNDEPGSIINISSVAGLVGDCPAAYSAAKGGVRMLTKSTAIECGKLGYNIRVNAIFPGTVDTAMFQQITYTKLLEDLKKLHPIGRIAQPIEIAKGVLFLASDDSSFMTGSDLVIDGGMTAGAGGVFLDLPLE